MDNSLHIRDTILQKLKQEFREAVMAEFDGNYFKAADIALPYSDGIDVYRIAVIKHDNKKDFCG